MSDVSAAGGLRKTPFLDRLLDSLLDPGRRERTVLALLAAYAAIWSLYGAIAKSSQDIHFDMGEMIAWSREVTFGTPKHPPLPAWLVRAWFSVFPLAGLGLLPVRDRAGDGGAVDRLEGVGAVSHAARSASPASRS